MAGAVLMVVSATHVAHAQSLLSEPDFSGMYIPNASISPGSVGVSAVVVARDAQRGWAYVQSGGYADVRLLINGVQVGKLSRVNDSGQLDLSWVPPDDVIFQPISVLANGDLLLGVSQRLRQSADGRVHVEPFRWTDDVLFHANGLPVARDVHGNLYAFLYSLSPTRSVLPTLRRVSSVGAPDGHWRLDIDSDPGNPSRFAVGADGSVFYISTRPDAPSGKVAYTLSRTSASDSLRWSQSLGGMPTALAADATGRVYVLGEAVSSQGHVNSLLRFDAAGAVDARWAPAANVAWPSASAALRVLDDRLLVVARRSQADLTVAATMISTARADDGSVLASRDLPGVPAITRVEDEATIVASDFTGITLFTLGLRDFVERRIPVTIGSSPIIAGIARWGDGYVLGGQFEYWYDGIRYTNLMRLTAALKPDPIWQPRITGIINALTVDRDGGLLVAGDKLLGAQTNLLRFGADGELDARWIKRLDGVVSTVAAATNGVVYVGGRFSSIDGVSRSSIARFQADGSLDTAWTQRPPWCPQSAMAACSSRAAWVTKIIDAGSGGVLALWRNTGGVMLDDGQYLSRFSAAPDGATLPKSSALNNIFDPTSIAQDPVTGLLYGVHSAVDPATQRGTSRFVRLLPTTLEIDPFWTPLTDSPHVIAFNDTHMILANGRRLTRLVNTAANDPYWTLGRTDVAGWLSDVTGMRALSWPTRGAPLAVRPTAQAVEPRAVIEYFGKDAQRFFMTARPAEQQQLDALPAQFARTEMQFTAFDGAVVPPSGIVSEAALPLPLFNPAGAVPMCRFYAPPDRGGSNTHFYGRGSDCQFLNTVSAVVNEGFDFAAPPPKDGACPTNASIPVYRLFNNQSASNNGNHRYVVSQVRLAEMTALGWVDEGIAFCAVTATDSRPLGRW